ncbi:MAG: SnoaL-like protein [Actinobacteria bacterium]|jgi:hypothetical protein|nr:SnoaL-like protein [Actinomycetota bacterium]
MGDNGAREVPHGRGQQGAQAIARRLTSALEARDLESLGNLLAPDVRWGGEEDTPQTCHSRDDVLA